MNEIKRIEHMTFIHNSEPSKNYGMSNQLYCFRKDDHITRTLIKFETDKLEELHSDDKKLINMKLYISVNRPMDTNFSITAYPLTKDWVEGLGSVHNIDDGVNWTDTGNGEWDNEGGDYDATESYNVDINDEFQYIEINLSDYLDRIFIDGEENFGIILISNETKIIKEGTENEEEVSISNAYNFAMYSDNDPSGYDPFIQILDDDYANYGSDPEKETDAIEYDGEYPIIIDPYNYKFNHEKNDFFMCQVNIKPRYSRNNLFYPENKLRYLPDIKYKMVDESRGKVIYDYSNYTKIPIRDRGLLLTVSTRNLNRGNYYIVMKYVHNDGSIFYSNRVHFSII